MKKVKEFIRNQKVGYAFECYAYEMEKQNFDDPGYVDYLRAIDCMTTEFELGKKPTPIRFIATVTIPLLIGMLVCKVLGTHKWEMECGGDAESGPITSGHCTRCGHVMETIYGM